MGEVSIKVNIAGRSYPLTISENEEGHVRQAEKRIDDSIENFRQNYAVKDKQDLLAMAALQLAAQKQQVTNQPSDPGIEDHLGQLEKLLDSYLG